MAWESGQWNAFSDHLNFDGEAHFIFLLFRRKEIQPLESDDLPDEMDLASSEYLQSFTFRLRGREKTFLQKIDHALEKIEEGTFGLCEQCGELISLKRLEARLETTLCIRCKEDQERIEKAYG